MLCCLCKFNLVKPLSPGCACRGLPNMYIDITLHCRGFQSLHPLRMIVRLSTTNRSGLPSHTHSAVFKMCSPRVSTDQCCTRTTLHTLPSDHKRCCSEHATRGLPGTHSMNQSECAMIFVRKFDRNAHC